jgi:hypothetical protein
LYCCSIRPFLCFPFVSLAACGFLYYAHQKDEYKATARWLSGLQTINITSIVFAARPGAITATLQGLFLALPLSLKIEACVLFDNCVTLWDNTYGCCGTNKHFNIGVTFSCKDQNPYIYNPSVAVQVDPFEITEKIIGRDSRGVGMRLLLLLLLLLLLFLFLLLLFLSISLF